MLIYRDKHISSSMFCCKRKREMALHLLILAFWFLATAVEGLETAERCQDKCGDVLIPYPFGIGDDPKCYRNDQFRIYCTGDSTTPYKPMLSTAGGRVEVMNISVLGNMSIRFSMSGECPGMSNKVPYIDLGDGPYTLSDTRNKYTAIGCDFFGILDGRKEDGHSWRAVCSPNCSNNATIVDGECAGSGCCQFLIPTGLKNIEGYTRPWDSTWDNSTSTYTFLVDKEQFKFSKSDLQGTNFCKRSKDMQVVVNIIGEASTYLRLITNEETNNQI